ncbi:MAG: hypothetical protein HQK79_15730, partial [Desulfobacterales bacterium]|nr:hypothetical protein [Desulfobacterales bacterium]
MTNEENIAEQIDIRDYLRIILKHKWTILSIFTIVVVTTIIYSYTAIPLYQASTRIIIEKENPNVVSIQEVMA